MIFHRCKIVGLYFLNTTCAQLVNYLVELASDPNSSVTIYPVNTDVLIQSRDNASLANALNDDVLLLADGMPIVWLSKIFNNPLRERVAGSDLIEALCSLGAGSGFKFYFLGAGPGVGDLAARRINEVWGSVVCGCLSPSRDEILDDEKSHQMISTINQSGANILLVGFGAPLQEIWLDKYKSELNTRINITVGGTIDFLAGTKSRAPKFLRLIGMEWCYRLIKEPRRLWRRYLIRDAAIITLFIQGIANRYADIFIRGHE